MRNVRLAQSLSILAAAIAVSLFLYCAFKLILHGGCPYRGIYGAAQFWFSASWIVGLMASAIAIIVFAYTSLVLSYAGHLDPVVIWAARAWRDGNYDSALRRVRFFSHGEARTPLLALILTAADRPAEAYALATKSEPSETDIEDPAYQPEFARGRATLAQADYSIASSHFERLYERFPRSTVARFGLGDLLLWTGENPERARQLLTSALKHDSTFLPHWNRLGFEAELRASHAWSLAVLGSSDEFQYSFNEALRLAGRNKPVRAAVCLRLGYALEALGHYASARQYWAAAHEIDPHGWSGKRALQNLNPISQRS